MTQTEKLIAFYGSLILAKLFEDTFGERFIFFWAVVFFILYLKDL